MLQCSEIGGMTCKIKICLYLMQAILRMVARGNELLP